MQDQNIDIALPEPEVVETPVEEDGAEIDIALHNPEDKERERAFRLHKINVLAICGVMAVCTGFMILGKRPTVSEEEKRDLTTCPHFSVGSYLDGTFTAQFSKFFNDTVPMRSTFKHLIAQFRGHLGLEFEEMELHGQLPVQDELPVETQPTTEPPTVPTENTDISAEVTETVPVTETEPPTTEPEEDEGGEIANNILIVKNRGIMLYGGGFSAGERYAATLNEYKSRLGADVTVYSLVAPTSVSFYLPKKFQDMSASETENIDHLNGFLDGVTPVDAYGALLPHKDEDIYSRTDHHWAPLGAYYAAQAFADTAGVPFAPLDQYEKVVKEGYVGTLYGFSGSAKLKDNPEDFVYYVPQNTYTCTYYNTDMTNEREAPLMLNLDHLDPASWYLVFMGGDERITHLTTDCRNSRKLCIIKDSYGNALVPALTSSFEEIWVVDMRYFKPNIITFMQERGITDVLFAMNTYSATGGNAEKLQTILNQ